jgi:hypothetical protein
MIPNEGELSLPKHSSRPTVSVAPTLSMNDYYKIKEEKSNGGNDQEIISYRQPLKRSRSLDPGRERDRSRSRPRARKKSTISFLGNANMDRMARKYGESYIFTANLEEEIDDDDFWTFGNVLNYLIPTLLLVISSIFLLISAGQEQNNTSKVNPRNAISNDLQPEDIKDPFFGKQTLGSWNSPGGDGLELEVLNALDDTWQYTFGLTVIDWTFGRPNALALEISKINHEEACDLVEGKIKICNGDFGATNWLGFNSLVVKDDGIITGSAIRLNDYYLQEDNVAARQYVLCHELGHSFGLPHSDENFNNEYPGNCLASTFNFNRNASPDESNYEALAALYGSVKRGTNSKEQP